MFPAPVMRQKAVLLTAWEMRPTRTSFFFFFHKYHFRVLWHAPVTGRFRSSPTWKRPLDPSLISDLARRSCIRFQQMFDGGVYPLRNKILPRPVERHSPLAVFSWRMEASINEERNRSGKFSASAGSGSGPALLPRARGRTRASCFPERFTSSVESTPTDPSAKARMPVPNDFGGLPNWRPPQQIDPPRLLPAQGQLVHRSGADRLVFNVPKDGESQRWQFRDSAPKEFVRAASKSSRKGERRPGVR